MSYQMSQALKKFCLLLGPSDVKNSRWEETKF